MCGESCWLLAALVRWCVLKLSYILHTHIHTHERISMHAHARTRTPREKSHVHEHTNWWKYSSLSNLIKFLLQPSNSPPPAFLRLFSPPQILMFAGRFQQTSHPCRRVKGWPLKASPLHTKRCCAPLAFKGSLLQG